MWRREFLGALFLLGLFLPGVTIAWPPTYGGEFAFTNKDLIKGSDRIYQPGELIEVETEENTAARDLMAKRLLDDCRTRKCRVQTRRNRYESLVHRIIYEDGWWFQIATDPYVVEVQTKPATLTEIRHLTRRMQRDIFEVAAKCGLYPTWDEGGGHIHIGYASAFMGKPGLFRDFIVDYMNHAELSLGVMEYSKDDATPFARLSREKRAAFGRIIGDFDNHLFVGDVELARRVQRDVYLRGQKVKLPSDDLARNMALNLNRMIDPAIPSAERTIEIRAVRTQLSADEYRKLVELFEGRIEYLDSQKGKLAFVDRGIPRVEARLRLFRTYVEEAGKDPLDYLFILPKRWRARYLSMLGKGCAARLAAMGIRG